MSTLYVDRKGTRIGREGRALVVYDEGGRRSTVPAALLDRVVLIGAVEMDSGVLTFLSSAGVALVALGGRHHQQLAIVSGEPHNEVRRRVAQYGLFTDSAWRVWWSSRLVQYKLLAQQRFIGQALQVRPDDRHPLSQAATTLSDLRKRINDTPQDGLTLGQLRGLEGAGAAAYFRGYQALFPPSLEFNGRNRRPPRDPVNAVLSLGYTLLHADATGACHLAGLDPLLGYYHEPEHGRASLAADLVEPLRPRIDRLVWNLFRSRELTGSNFSHQDDACLLDKEGRAVFYPAYETAARPWRRALRRFTTGLAGRLPEISRGCWKRD